jgi:protein involved in polysaccharide export with SLBB domain
MKKIYVIFALAIVILAMLLGCVSQNAVLKYEPAPVATAPQEPPEYFIQPGDELDIKFFYNPILNEAIVVRPDGKISLQLVDEVRAAGLTPAQLDDVLTQKYAKELKKPAVTVIVRSFTGWQVYVGGEVNTPGLINLAVGMTALQAVINAGGLRETAEPTGAIVIRKGRDNKPIPFRVDLNETIYGKGDTSNFQLKPSDIVYVPKSSIAKANKFVNQYIERLLLFRGVNFGFSYEVHAAEPK